MGSLTKRSNELLQRVPGLRRGPAERVKQKSRRSAARAKERAKGTGPVAAVRRGAKGVFERGRSLSATAVERLGRNPARERWRKRAGIAAGAGTAAGAAYLFRRGGKAKRAASYGAHTAAGKAKGVAASVTPTETPNDETLADRVRSVVLRPADAPKGEVNINVVDGVVYLRGELEQPDEIRRLIEATESVDGVRRVENLLHTPA